MRAGVVRPVGELARLELDHKQPLRRGGAVWSEANLQPLCKKCHLRKTHGENEKPNPERAKWREFQRAEIATLKGK